MSYVLDAAVVLLLLLGAIIGIKRGFVRSAVKLVGCVAAIVLAAWLSTFAANWAFDTFLKAPIEQSVESSVSSVLQSSADSTTQALTQVLNGLPDIVKQAMQMFGVGTADELAAKLEQAGLADQGVAAVADTAVTYAIRPVCVLLLQVLCFLILFLLLMVVVGLLARLLDKIFHLPLLKQLNGLLGLVLGLAEFSLLVLVLCTLLQLYAIAAPEGAWVTKTTIDQSFLVRWIAQNNPIIHWSILSALVHPMGV